jgi:hypothetical protein
MNHSVHRDVDAARWREGDEARAPSSMPRQIGKGVGGEGTARVEGLDAPRRIIYTYVYIHIHIR